MSTPRLLQLPDGVRRVTVGTRRGSFAALQAHPVAGACERQPALLVPGYTGSKEDFLPVLGPLAAAGRCVVAIDMRGQYESPPADDEAGYRVQELAADIAAVAEALATREDSGPMAVQRVHLLGHSFGGLVAQDVMLGHGAQVGSLTLMSSGPGALTGARAMLLRAALAGLDGATRSEVSARVRWLWDTQMEPAAVAGGVPTEIIEFLRERLLLSCPTGLRAMGQAVLACPDRTPALARQRSTPVLVIYGEDDDAWLPPVQEDMAQRLGAQRVCIPGAAHSPAVEAPETVAGTLTAFWNSVECRQRRPADDAADRTGQPQRAH